LVASALPLAIAPESAQAAPIVLTASDGAWTTVRHANSVQKSNYLSVTSTEDPTYLKLPGASLEGLTVTSAKLELRVRSTTATQPGVVAYPTSTRWSSATLTSANKPAAAERAVSNVSARPMKGRTLSIPLDPQAISTTGDFAL